MDISTKKTKERLDILLVENNYFDSRQKAQAAIMMGSVYVNGKKVIKAGTKISTEEEIEVRGETCPYVGRGGLKLEKALKDFKLSVEDRICIDAGASTGGFTDCLLQHGASFVYAIDVGYGQFEWKLRNDHRVKLVERTNIRYLSSDDLYDDFITPKATVCAIDLSFISVTKVLENISSLMDIEKHIIILIKPQFEAGKDLVPKSGVVVNRDIHFEVIKAVHSNAEKINFSPVNLTYSPITGNSGNIEYLTYLTNKPDSKKLDEQDINNVINQAFQDLVK